MLTDGAVWSRPICELGSFMRNVRRIMTAVIAAAMIVGTGTGTASGTPTGVEATPDAGTSVTATDVRSARSAEPAGVSPQVNLAACPVPGQRVRTASNPKIYLVAPNGDYYYLSATNYDNLYDSFAGVVYNESLPGCIAAAGGAWENSGFYLLRSGNLNDPRIYIFDGTYPNAPYRWIVSGTVFSDKYGFSWGKVITAGSPNPVTPRGPDWT
jgi:hypothetical protein